MYNRLSGRHDAASRTKYSSSVAVQSIDLLGMLIHQRDGLVRIEVDGESIIVVRAPGEVGVSKLPEQIRHLLLERNGLPPAHGLEARVVGDGAEILQAGLGREPAVLLVDDGLAGRAGGLGVVPDPLVGPGDGLCPPLEACRQHRWISFAREQESTYVGVCVEHAEVDGVDGNLGVEVTAVGAVVGPVVRLAVEAALAAPGDQVVGVQLLDERAHLSNPLAQDLRVAAGRATGEVAGSVSAAARLIAFRSR